MCSPSGVLAAALPAVGDRGRSLVTRQVEALISKNVVSQAADVSLVLAVTVMKDDPVLNSAVELAATGELGLLCGTTGDDLFLAHPCPSQAPPGSAFWGAPASRCPMTASPTASGPTGSEFSRNRPVS